MSTCTGSGAGNGRILATFVASTLLLFSAAAVMPSHADALKKRTCGTIVFIDKGDYESGGLVKSEGVKCRRAKKMMFRCGTKGIRPKGWKASAKASGRLVLRHRKKRVWALLAGASPPKMGKCIG